jgi:hypothetical protein
VDEVKKELDVPHMNPGEKKPCLTLQIDYFLPHLVRHFELLQMDSE